MEETLKDPTQADYEAARATLTPSDLTAQGIPKVEPISDALVANGFRKITAAERDVFEESIPEAPAAPDAPEEAAAPEEAPAPGFLRIRLDAADANPLPIYVHGVGSFSLRVGEEKALPEAAIDALRNAGGVSFTILED
jgi:hypothetical protein